MSFSEDVVSHVIDIYIYIDTVEALNLISDNEWIPLAKGQ